MALEKIFEVDNTGVKVGMPTSTATAESPKFEVGLESDFLKQVDIKDELTIGDGWHQLTLYNQSGVTTSASTTNYGRISGVAYRVEGNHVYVSGSVAYTPINNGSVDRYFISSAIPEQYRPQYAVSTIGTCANTSSGKGRYNVVYVDTNGQVRTDFTVLLNGSSGALSTTTTTWTDFQIEYWVNEN